MHADILRKFDNMVEVVMPKLPSSFDSISDPEGRAALLWLLGEYGEVSVPAACMVLYYKMKHFCFHTAITSFFCLHCVYT